jgi:hypothetical protein
MQQDGKYMIVQGYHGLTQACRQLHSEFGPLINSLERTIVRFPDIIAYLNDCHRTSSS